MQDQIRRLNYAANSEEYTDDIREYAKAMTSFLWSFEKMSKEQDRINKKMLQYYESQ